MSAALWVRHVRRPDAFTFLLTSRNSFLPENHRSGSITRVSTYNAVQILEATSVGDVGGIYGPNQFGLISERGRHTSSSEYSASKKSVSPD